MKITLPTITNGQDLTALNNNFASIATALNMQVLYRTNPIGEDNTINQDIDYNGYRAYNLSDVLVNGVSIASIATVASAAATQAAASATTAIAQAGIATAAANTATATIGTALLKVNNLSDLASVATAKSNLSLDQVTNTTDANKPVSTAQATALALKAPLASPTFSGTVGGITATMVGLANVTNTSDANKPVSTAQATAIALKLNHAGDVTGGNATAGDIGEYVTSTVTAISPTNGTPFTATSILLSAGDWDVTGTISYINGVGTISSTMNASLSLTTATQNAAIGFMTSAPNVTATTALTTRMSTPVVRFSLSASTTIFLVGVTTFSGGTTTSDGLIRARRIR